MSETPESSGGGAGAAGTRPLDYPSSAALPPASSGMLRLGGSLGIAACAVGIAIMVAGPASAARGTTS